MIDQPPAIRGGHVKSSAEERAAIRHDYVEGAHTRHGSDGRLYRLCRVCDLPANAGRHRPEETVAAAQVKRLATWSAKRAPRASDPLRSGARPLPALALVEAPTAPEAPTPKLAPSTGRRRSIRPDAIPMEYLQLALSIDRLLSLPADAIPWRLRLRLADIRGLLEVPTFPALTADYTPVADPTPEVVLEARPDLSYHAPAAPATQTRGILRGIRSDRIKRLATRAQEDGWDVSLTGSGHLRLAKGSQVIIGSTTAETGSGHGWGNLRAQAKRAGLNVDGL